MGRHLLPTAALATCSTALLWYLYRRQQQQEERADCNYPPLPPNPHWLLGNALCLYDPKLAPEILALEWMNKLNSKVISFQLPIFLPLPRIIAIADDELVHHVIKSGFPKSPTYKDLLPLIGSKSMVVTEGKEWSVQRRRYNPGFSPDFLVRVVSVIVDKCHRMMDACKEDIAANNITILNDRTIDLTSDVIAQVAFGEDWGSHSPTLDNLRDLVAEMGHRQKNGLRKFHPLVRWRIRRMQRQLDRDMIDLVQRRLQQVVQHEGELEKDVLSLSLKAAMGSTPPKDFAISKDDMEGIISQLKTFYFAGHDTTATAIAWAIWLLAQHPDKLARVREEITKVLGKQWVDNMTTEQAPEFAAWQRCTYLEAVLKEVLRLYPPAATARYVADPNATFQGQNIGNSILWLSAYCSQRHPDHWKDPDAFQPERFLDWNESEGHNKYHWMPFSRGPRDCIGKYFAILEGKIAIAMMVMKFNVAEVVHCEEVMAARITNVPLNGCQVKLALR